MGIAAAYEIDRVACSSRSSPRSTNWPRARSARSPPRSRRWPTPASATPSPTTGNRCWGAAARLPAGDPGGVLPGLLPGRRRRSYEDSRARHRRLRLDDASVRTRDRASAALGSASAAASSACCHHRNRPGAARRAQYDLRPARRRRPLQDATAQLARNSEIHQAGRPAGPAAERVHRTDAEDPHGRHHSARRPEYVGGHPCASCARDRRGSQTVAHLRRRTRDHGELRPAPWTVVVRLLATA